MILNVCLGILGLVLCVCIYGFVDCTRELRRNALPEALRDPIKVRQRGEFLSALEKAGCHRALLGHEGCWRVRCHLGKECYLASKARAAVSEEAKP